MSRLCAALLLPLLLAASCGEQQPRGAPQQAPQQAQLQGGVVARVGDHEIYALSVAAIAAQRSVPVAEARDAAVYDALLASGADQALPERELAAAHRQVLARAVLRQLLGASEAKPIGEQELEAATAERWLQVARPRGYRSVHAVVKASEEASEDEHAAARSIAEKIRSAVEPVAEQAPTLPPPDHEDHRTFEGVHVANIDKLGERFRQKAGEVAPGDERVVIQPLQVVAADGRVLDKNIPPPGGNYDITFAKAIAQLDSRGALSEVVKTPFGYHVILLLEITEERQLDRPARLKELRDGILRGRGARLQRELLDAVAKQQGVQIKTNADALLQMVSVR